MSDEIIELPISSELDLHTFHPREIKTLIPDYLRSCREKEISIVRIVHGKGTGTLREIVHSILSKLDFVSSFRLAGDQRGSWGATIVELKKDQKCQITNFHK